MPNKLCFFVQVADVSEAVRQYADALMLSGESAIGSYGQKALSVLHTTSTRMESWSRQENTLSFVNNKYQLKLSLLDKIADQICNCAAEMGNLKFLNVHIFCWIMILRKQNQETVLVNAFSFLQQIA